MREPTERHVVNHIEQLRANLRATGRSAPPIHIRVLSRFIHWAEETESR